MTIESLAIFLCLFVVGHFTGAFLIFLNHRFVLHGSLGKTRLLKWARELHAQHHKYAYCDDHNDDAYANFFSSFSKTPWKVKFIVGSAIVLLTALVPGLGFGLGTSMLYYEFAHKKIHGSWRNSRIGRHHEMHHKFPHYNFSGTYPFIDSIFKTKKTAKSNR